MNAGAPGRATDDGRSVLILDTTHGADILAQRMAGRGHRIVCVDIYRKTSDATVEAIKGSGASFATEVPRGHYDVVITPGHCPDSFLEGVTWNERMTFSRAVGMLVGGEGFRIEVTGVKGKTSACSIIAHVLSTAGMSVFLHNSRAYGPWEDGRQREDGKMSINPASILRMPASEYDVTVSEVSLGGSGKADIALITNIADDYPIAAGTRRASEAKADILCDRVNIVPEDESELWGRYGKKVRGYGGRVRVIGTKGIGGTVEMEIDYDGIHRVSMGGGYLALQYVNATEAALEVFLAMGVPAAAVVKGLGSFRGVPGRGEVLEKDGVTTIRERNPGISHLSVDHTLGCIRRSGYGGSVLAVLDPVNRKVCDTLDADRIREVAEKHGARLISADEPRPDGYGVVVEFIKEGYQ